MYIVLRIAGSLKSGLRSVLDFYSIFENHSRLYSYTTLRNVAYLIYSITYYYEDFDKTST